MADRMLRFTGTAQQQPEKRAVAARVADFGEIYQDFAIPAAEAQFQPVQPVRRAVLLDPLPAEQQHT